MENSTFFIGIDVSMDVVHATAGAKKPTVFPHTIDGIASLYAWARAQAAGQPLWFAAEASGIYSTFLAFYLYTNHQAALSILNPRRVRNHARAKGFRSKTDSQDALVILDYARTNMLRPWQPGPRILRQLGQLLDQVRRLEAELRRVHNWQHRESWTPILHDAVADSSQALVHCLEQQIANLEQQIDELQAADLELDCQVQLLTTIPGIADRSARLLIALTRGEITFRTGKELTGFAGLGPGQRQSGTSLNLPARIDKQGNAALRATLYMCCISGGTWNPHLKVMKDRLNSREKNSLKGKQVRVALMRKLLLIARGVLVSGKPYDASLAYS